VAKVCPESARRHFVYSHTLCIFHGYNRLLLASIELRKHPAELSIIRNRAGNSGLNHRQKVQKLEESVLWIRRAAVQCMLSCGLFWNRLDKFYYILDYFGLLLSIQPTVQGLETNYHQHPLSIIYLLTTSLAVPPPPAPNLEYNRVEGS
jgi:hypothetical protein